MIVVSATSVLVTMRPVTVTVEMTVDGTHFVELNITLDLKVGVEGVLETHLEVEEVEAEVEVEVEVEMEGGGEGEGKWIEE